MYIYIYIHAKFPRLQAGREYIVVPMCLLDAGFTSAPALL